MRKYKKFNKRNNIGIGYLVFIIFIIGIIAMSVGYSYLSEIMTIKGTANAKYEIYNIEYVLNGGTNPENVVTTYRIIDEIPLPIPTRSQYLFDGWYDNEKYSGNKYTKTNELNDNITLYAKWKNNVNFKNEYEYDGEYVFTGSNYINTNIYLYSEENINKNFIISFDIVAVDKSNVNHSALMNSMDESKSPWNGNVVKVSVSGSKKSLKFESNSNTNTAGDVYISDTVKNVKIVRIDNLLYYSFDGGKFVKINDYTGFTSYFDVPVTFGASMDGNKNPYRYFTGTLANMSVSFLDDDVVIDDLEEKEEKVEKVVYDNKGPLKLDGEKDYIDTGLYLFTYENINKDFEVSFTIDSIEEGNVSQATVVNMKDERLNPCPGFVYRIYQGHDDTIRFEAKAGTGSGATNKMYEVKQVKISRINSKMYLSINNGEKKLVYDYTGFTKFFDIPLTIGASLDSKGNPFRFFKGTLSDIRVTVTE